jgi:hypothetical protein
MWKVIANHPVRMTAFSWALALSSGYLLGKTIGTVIGKFMFDMPVASLWETENAGIAVGLVVGSMVSGLLTTFILRSKFQVRNVHYLISAVGWLVAMLIAVVIMFYIGQTLAD